MRSRADRVARVFGVIAILASVVALVVLLILRLLVSVGLMHSAEERALLESADAVLMLIQEGDYETAASLIAPECHREGFQQYGLEAIEKRFEGTRFTHDLSSVKMSATAARAIGDIRWETPAYGHRISVSFERAQVHEPWSFCSINIAGYS